jgi:hypothetical protein
VENYGEQRSAIEYMSECSPNKEYSGESRKTQTDLMKLLESSYLAPISSQKSKDPVKGVSKKENTSPSSKKQDKFLEESKRKCLMDKIAVFSSTGSQNEEMTLSSELSSYDRRLVHEFAEQLGLSHRSEGVEGFDRRIILTIQKNQSFSASNDKDSEVPSNSSGYVKKEEKDENINDHRPFSNFAALAIEDSDCDESNGEDFLGNEETSNKILVEESSPVANDLLAQLAKERAERQAEKQPTTQTRGGDALLNKSNNKDRKRKSKGQKLGCNLATKSAEKEENLDDLDDMAFLDAQIEKVQTSHGRKVAGSGKAYRTIVNGILNSRPEPKAKPTNQNASASLQSKLKEASNARKPRKNK